MTLCSGPCPPDPVRDSSITIEAGDLEFIESGYSNLITVRRAILEEGAPGGLFNIEGDLTIVLGGSRFEAPGISLSAGGGIEIETGTSIQTGSAPLVLCARASDCLPYEAPSGTISAGLLEDGVFEVWVVGPLSGPVGFYATGEIDVRSGIVPEPGSAGMILLGLMALAYPGHRRNRSARAPF